MDTPCFPFPSIRRHVYSVASARRSELGWAALFENSEPHKDPFPASALGKVHLDDHPIGHWFAALKALEGQIISMCDHRHRHQKWLKFLRAIDDLVPAGKQIHMIVHNYSTHKHARVERWLARHPRFHMHFTPTACSWLNMMERFFRDLTEKSSAPGSLAQCRGSDHRDLRVHRPSQRQSQALYLDRQSCRHPGEAQARTRTSS